MKEIRWSEEAVERLKEQGRYVAFHNPKAAKALIRRLRKKVQALKELPLMGRIVPELEQEDIREIIDKQYRIVYQVTEDYIEIITIFETRQLFPLKKKKKLTSRRSRTANSRLIRLKQKTSRSSCSKLREVFGCRSAWC